MTDWNRIYTGFCEYQLNGHPEVFNVITSGFIVFIGMWGLFLSKLSDHIVRQIYSGFIICGMGSIMLHAKGLSFYSKLDSIPMIIVSWYVNYIAWRMIYYTCFSPQSRLLDIFHDLSSLITSFCLVWTLSTRAVKGYPFNVKIELAELLAIPNCSTILALSIMVLYYRLKTDNGFRKCFEIYCLIGISSMLFAVLSWTLTDPECQKDKNIVSSRPFYAYAHGLWHIFFPYGAHLLIQMLIYIEHIVRGVSCSLKTSDNRVMYIIWKVFPLIQN